MDVKEHGFVEGALGGRPRPGREVEIDAHVFDAVDHVESVERPGEAGSMMPMMLSEVLPWSGAARRAREDRLGTYMLAGLVLCLHAVAILTGVAADDYRIGAQHPPPR